MKFEERLSEIINRTEVPDELLPENIAVMLRERSGRPQFAAASKKAAVSAQKRSIIMRTTAAAAACAALAFGTLALSGGRDEQEQIEAPISYRSVSSPDSYSALYDIYTGITLDGGERRSSERTVGEEFSETVGSGDFSDCGTNPSDADIAVTDGNYMYCLKDSTVYAISTETMDVVSKIENPLDPPVEIYLDGGNLILISAETEEIGIGGSGSEKAAPKASEAETEAGNVAPASDVPAKDADIYPPADGNSDVPNRTAPDDKTGSEGGSVSRRNAVVRIYDVTDPADPVQTTVYKQNGSFVTSKIADGVLYMATAYSDYRVKPLDTQEDLDSFVPAYYINGDKFYLAAEDIIVPSGAASTDYTVVSAIDLSKAEAAVKAVLGSSRNVYCSADALYVAAVSQRDGREYSVISSFGLTGGGISYRASCSVEGAVLGSHSMNEYGGLFRIAAEIVDEDGNRTVSVYVLDRTLKAVNTAGQLFPGGKASAVRFERQYARIIDSKTGKAAVVLDLSTEPPTAVQSIPDNEVFLYGYSENELLGIGRTDGGAVTLTMYNAADGSVIAETELSSNTDGGGKLLSAVFTDRRAALIDREHGIIGIPVYSECEFGIKNSYYVYSFGDSGFVPKGSIDYMDVDDSAVFKRGAVSGDTLYIMGGGRIISARLSDLKIIQTSEY